MKTGALEYYMALDYPAEIRAIPKDLGGGYSASIPCLGRWAFYADGETAQEALDNLQDVKATLIQDMLERGKAIPAPPPIPEKEEEAYGGRILLRVSRELHRDVAKRAEKNGCSLNYYISTVLAHHIGGAQWVEDSVAKALQTCGRVSADSLPPQGQFNVEPPESPSLEGLAKSFTYQSSKSYGLAS
jgi:antitoxin HicB